MATKPGPARSAQTWHFVYPRWWIPSAVLIAFCCLAYLLMSLYVTSILYGIETARDTQTGAPIVLSLGFGDATPTPIDAGGLILKLLPGEIAAVLAFIYAIVVWRRSALCAANASVQISNAHFKSTDGRGKPQSIAWDDIQQMRLVRAGGFGQAREIFLHHTGGLVRLPSSLERTDELVAAVTTRAGLTSASTTWYQQRFSKIPPPAKAKP